MGGVLGRPPSNERTVGGGRGGMTLHKGTVVRCCSWRRCVATLARNVLYPGLHP